ncbi:MAG: undecaprenyldiphospho-muramoylpentapeptide beta-N-acetylglucosaminyltransferase [Burkholderiales bacterium]
MSMPRVLMIMAGGTGGHIYPGLAVAAAMSALGWRVIWLGTRHGMETRIVPQHGYEMVWLTMGGVRGNGWLRKLLLPAMLMMACVQALSALLRYRPDVVLGMGGYPSFPGGLMAGLLRKPLVIHEQNAIAGLSNRILACLADRVAVGFPAAFTHAEDKPIPCGKVQSVWTGNPVRAEISAVQSGKAKRSGRLRILVVGGSLGAAALNRTVPQALSLIDEAGRPEIVHQAGAKHLAELRDLYARLGITADVRPFIEDMAAVYEWCDIAITRAGALTIAELAAAGVPALLVPYPHAVDDHQTRNAAFLVESGAAKLMAQSELNAERLALVLRQLDRTQLSNMAERAKAAAKPDATAAAVRICMEMIDET